MESVQQQLRGGAARDQFTHGGARPRGADHIRWPHGQETKRQILPQNKCLVLCASKEIMRPPPAAATRPLRPAALPPSRALFPTRRHSNCELGSRKPIKVQANPPALPRQFPVRPQLSESCLQAGKDPRIWGEQRPGNSASQDDPRGFISQAFASLGLSKTPRGL